MFRSPLCRRLAFVAVCMLLLMISLPVTMPFKVAFAQGGLVIPSTGTVTQPFLGTYTLETWFASYYDQNNTVQARPTNGAHSGVDISNTKTDCTPATSTSPATGQPVYAAAAGTVVWAGFDTSNHGRAFGWSVVVRHGFGVGGNSRYTYTLYGHMGTVGTKAATDPKKGSVSCLQVQGGQQVNPAGSSNPTVLGYQGSSGLTKPATHVHFTIFGGSQDYTSLTSPYVPNAYPASPDFYTCLALTQGDSLAVSSVSAGQNNCVHSHFQLSPSSVSVTTTSGQNPSPQTLTMTNSGNGTLSWNLTSSPPSWLAVSPTSGSLAPTASQSITLTFSLPTIPSTYSTTLTFNDPNADNSPASLSVTATVVGWTTVSSPNVTSGSLSGVAEVSASDIWAVGNYVNSNNSNQPLIEHWDGNSWTMISNPSSNGYLQGVTALSSDNVWAVGRYYTNAAYQTLIEHWNGSSWSIIQSPNNSSKDNYLYSVSGVLANDIWAVGQYIPDAGGADQPLIEHWDGNSWTIVSGPDVGSGNDSSLEGISYLLPNDIWAVGYTTDGYPNFDWTPLTEHYDGTSWKIVPSPTVNPANPWRLEGVTMLSSTDVWAVGAVYNNPPASPVPDLIEHWDGNSWTIMQSPTIGTYDALFSVSGTGSNDIWAVGYYADANSIIHTLIEHWDGNSWSIVSSPDGASYRNDLYGGVAVSSNDVWAVGDGQDNINELRQPLILRYH